VGDDNRPRFTTSVVKATAATHRSSLDLLGLPWPFSQTGLLTREDFVREADHRRIRMAGGWRLDVSGLEELHRQGLVVPFFRVDLADGGPERAIDVTESLTARHIHTTLIAQLYIGAAEGRVADPAAEVFQLWPTERRRALWPSVDSGYLYSQHQLLALTQVRSLVAALGPRRRRDSRELRWKLEESDQPDEDALDALRSWRSLAITLSALDTFYWPYITRRISHSAELWRSARLAFDPAATLRWLDLTVDRIEDQADQLRGWAHSQDVLGDFYDLVRRADSKAWETLRGGALTTMDLRMAAETLDRFAADVRGDPVRQQAVSVPLSRQGLGARPRSLDAALTLLRLSPHPALVVGVEGATEMLLVPRVMELLGIELDPSWIRVEDFGGTDRDLSLLARYASQPLLGEDRGDHVVLDRPPTRFLVMTDAEHRYRTLSDRWRQRKLLLD
jgi:hypothetical protein